MDADEYFDFEEADQVEGTGLDFGLRVYFAGAVTQSVFRDVV